MEDYNLEIDDKDNIISITRKITAQFADELSSDISEEQKKILDCLNHMPPRDCTWFPPYDDSFLYAIASAPDDSYLGLIRHGFNTIDSKVTKHLDTPHYDEFAVNCVRIGIAVTLLELVKNENGF